jgi:hypothetical protein
MTRRLKFLRQRPKRSLVRLSIPRGLLAAGAAALLGAPAALADSNLSQNWAGYAVHKPGAVFKEVSAAWKQPNVSCSRGYQTYSAMWVGLGGYSQTSNALEQIGTEIDCDQNGMVSSSAWFEMVPDPSHTIPLKVRPGDIIAARVTAIGSRVQLALSDKTRHWTFTRTFYPASLDASSAEWILEAPSACLSSSACAVLPLANFHRASFGFAKVKTTAGRTGTISNPAWDSTKITLSPGGDRFVAYNGSGTPAGAAQPSGLIGSGSAFNLAYMTVSVSPAPFFNPRLMPRAAYLRHLARR